MKKILRYLILTLSLFYLFFLWQFPYAQLKKGIIQGVEETFPVKLSIGQLTPAFPLHLLIGRVGLESGPLRFELPDIRVRQDFFSLLMGQTDFSFEEVGSPPRLKGEFHGERNGGRLKIWLKDLEIKSFLGKEDLFPVKLSGEAAWQWTGDDASQADGQAWALLKRGGVVKEKTSGPPSPLDLFETLRTEMHAQKGVLKVTRLEVTGKNLPGPVHLNPSGPGKGMDGFLDLGALLAPGGK